MNQILSHSIRKPTVITISATDPLGMSGVHADLRALTSMGVHGLCCITATTAQNQAGFFKVNAVSDDAFESQLDALMGHLECDVIKIGLLANANQVKILIDHPILKNKKIVLDPVLAASSGTIEAHESRVLAILTLLPFIDILTPNLDEAKSILGASTKNSENPNTPRIALSLLELGVQSVLLKGGHGLQPSTDYYCDSAIQFYLNHDVYQHNYNRGTGCAMASLISASLALGASRADAVVMAKMQMQSGWTSPFSISAQTGSLDFKQWVSPSDFSFNQAMENNGSSETLEQSTVQSIQLPVQLPNVFKDFDEIQLTFPRCESPLGLYPIFDRAEWLSRLLPLGIKVAQLRVKDLQGDALKQEIKLAVEIARQFNCQLFINDYWQLAIECGAYGVHLGQEDIDEADLKVISQNGLRLGLSSHCYYEVARAKTINPSYIAFGPVYETQTKEMPWIPQGPVGLAYWRAHLLGMPMVAIGGIHAERFNGVKATGVDSIAMITAITQADSPEETVRYFMDEFGR